MEVLLAGNMADLSEEAFLWACLCYFAALERVSCNCLFKDNNKGKLSKEFSTQSAALRQIPQPQCSGGVEDLEQRKTDGMFSVTAQLSPPRGALQLL